MKQSVYRTTIAPGQTADHVVSRRLALRCSGLAALGLVSHTAFAQTPGKTTEARRSSATPSKQMQEELEQSQTFVERLRNADSMDERRQIMSEQMAWQRQRAFEDLKDRLQISDHEWPVLKPRFQAVYDLVRPQPQVGPHSAQPQTEVEQKRRDLQELLRDEKAPLEQIKAKLTALRAARERSAQELSKARQALRQLMTLRQEAVLVLNGLLD
jgi:hypothetical protein